MLLKYLLCCGTLTDAKTASKLIEKCNLLQPNSNLSHFISGRLVNASPVSSSSLHTMMSTDDNTMLLSMFTHN